MNFRNQFNTLRISIIHSIGTLTDNFRNVLEIEPELDNPVVYQYLSDEQDEPLVISEVCNFGKVQISHYGQDEEKVNLIDLNIETLINLEEELQKTYAKALSEILPK